MNGINNFLGNSSGRYGKETVAALKMIGAHNQAALLERILVVAEDAGMTHDAIQQERSGLGEYAVVSFHEVRGSKWDKAFDGICDLESEIDYSGIWSCAEEFVREQSNEFHQALNCAEK